MQEVETDSKSINDVATILGRQISRPLMDRSYYRKVQSRKVFGQRDSLELILQKAEDKLAKVLNCNSTNHNITVVGEFFFFLYLIKSQVFTNCI